MGASISIELSGDDQRFLRRLQGLSDIRREEITEEMAEQLRTSTVERFRSTIAPDGRRWKPSIRSREAGGLPLTDTALLRNSIRAESDRDGLAVGTNVKYAATHQFGDRRTIQPRRAKDLRFKIGNQWVHAKRVTVDIPARPFLGISQADEEEIRAILEGAFEESV